MWAPDPQCRPAALNVEDLPTEQAPQLPPEDSIRKEETTPMVSQDESMLHRGQLKDPAKYTNKEAMGNTGEKSDDEDNPGDTNNNQQCRKRGV